MLKQVCRGIALPRSTRFAPLVRGLNLPSKRSFTFIVIYHPGRDIDHYPLLSIDVKCRDKVMGSYLGVHDSSPFT